MPLASDVSNACLAQVKTDHLAAEMWEALPATKHAQIPAERAVK